MDYAGVFLEAGRAAPSVADEVLRLPEWRHGDWAELLALARAQRVRASEIVIQRGAADRALYFVAAGHFEVGSTYVDGMSVTSLARISVGSVIGEQSFFDGLARSATVWARTEGELLKLHFDDYMAFAAARPGLARDLLFGLGRVLSMRLRNTSVRIRR